MYFAPTDALPPNLVEALKEHKLEVIEILREDEECHRTGFIQCKRQVFDLARDYLGEDGRALKVVSRASAA